MRGSNYFTLSLFFGVALTLAGCSVKGVPFKKIEQVPSGKAIVYLYRPHDPSNIFHLPQPPWDVFHGEALIASLEEEAYIAYLVDEGRVDLVLDPGPLVPNSELTILAAAGQVYWVQIKYQQTLFTNFPELSRVSPEVGASEAVTCKRRPGSYVEPRITTMPKAASPHAPEADSTGSESAQGPDAAGPTTTATIANPDSEESAKEDATDSAPPLDDSASEVSTPEASTPE